MNLLLVQCIRRWNNIREHIAHIHIGKAGGSTLDSILVKLLAILKKRPRCSLIKSYKDFKKCVVENPIDQKYFNLLFKGAHHDMHYINKAREENLNFSVATFGFARDPVDRFNSSFVRSCN